MLSQGDAVLRDETSDKGTGGNKNGRFKSWSKNSCKEQVIKKRSCS